MILRYSISETQISKAILGLSKYSKLAKMMHQTTLTPLLNKAQ